MDKTCCKDVITYTMLLFTVKMLLVIRLKQIFNLRKDIRKG